MDDLRVGLAHAALSEMDEVASAEVDFDSKKATVTMQPGSSLTREDCDEAFTGTRYSVETFESASSA